MKRPTKKLGQVPAAELAALLDAIASGARISTACSATGIDRATYLDWRHKIPLFRAAVDQAHAEYEIEALRSIGSETKGQQWILERTRPETYGRVDRIDLDISGLSDDQLRRIADGEHWRAVINTAATDSTTDAV